MEKLKESFKKIDIKLALALLFFAASMVFLGHQSANIDGLVQLANVSSSGGSVNCATENLATEIAKAGPGATINVIGDCTRQGKIIVSKSGTASQPIIINGGGAVIGAANRGGLSWNGSGAKVKGFNLYASGQSGPVAVNYLVIKGFEVTGTDFNASPVGAGIFALGNNNVIESNYIHDLPQVGLTVYTGSGSNAVKNNLIKNVGLYAGMVIGGSSHTLAGNDISAIRQYPPNSVTPPTAVSCCCGDPATYSSIGCETTCSSAGYDADGIKLSGNNHHLVGNYIHDISLIDSYNYNPHVDAVQTSGTVSGLVFEKNIIDLPKSYTLRNGKNCPFSGSKIFTSDSASNIIFKNNLFSNYGGIQIPSASGIKVLNNDFINFAYRAFELSPCADCLIKNNIFYGVGTDASISGNFSDSGLTAQLSNNFFYNTTGKAGSINPSFVGFNSNLGQGNFNLTSLSPCVNAGTNLSSLGVLDDFGSNLRPQGSAYDIGAYEFSQISCTENWTIGAWTPDPCTTGTQTRAITDSNNCGTALNKPATTTSQACVVSCIENWVAGDWTSCAGGTQTRTVTDSNNCGTTVNKPITSQPCTVACTPNWVAGDWAPCAGGTQTRTVTDSNACGIETGKPITSQSCTVAPTCSDAYCKKYGSSYVCRTSANKCCQKWGSLYLNCKSL